MTRDVEIYRNGAEGFITWVEDCVRLRVYPKGSTVKQWLPFSEFPAAYRKMWEEQKKILHECLKMKNGRFKYRLIIFMWPRGEGKSILTVLIQLWRMLWFPGITIILGANSINQIRFMHFDELVDIIKNSPKVYEYIGPKNLLQKQIQLTDDETRITGRIVPVSSFTGLYSGVDGYTFNEFHQAASDRFFVEIDTSMRGVKNALGVIDTTVAPKTHILHRLYKTFLKGEDPSLYFSYRQTDGLAEQFWNPEINQEYLDIQRERHPFDFERFFINSWESASRRVFSPEQTEAIQFLGADGIVGNHATVIELLTKKNQIIDSEKKVGAGLEGKLYSQDHLLAEVDLRLWPLEREFRLRDKFGPQMATVEILEKMSNLFDTDWAVLVGADRSAPTQSKRSAARTILTALAKGLPGSRSNPFMLMEGIVPHYVYILLHLEHVVDSSLEGLKAIVLAIEQEFDGIDMLTAETWGMFDLKAWCEEGSIPYTELYPNYSRQQTAFIEFYIACDKGRFKAPPLAVSGSKEEDILQEEMLMFDHEVRTDREGRPGMSGWFGSVEKAEKHGVQDDAVYAIGWGMYGGRHLSIDDFRERKARRFMGDIFYDKDLLGDY